MALQSRATPAPCPGTHVGHVGHVGHVCLLAEVGYNVFLVLGSRLLRRPLRRPLVLGKRGRRRTKEGKKEEDEGE